MNVAVTWIYELDLQSVLFADKVNTITKRREGHAIVYVHELSRSFNLLLQVSQLHTIISSRTLQLAYTRSSKAEVARFVPANTTGQIEIAWRLGNGSW